MIEHRKHMRLPLVFPVDLILADGRKFRGKTRNISFGGILLDLPEPPPQLKPSDLCGLVLILAEGEEPVVIPLEAEVRHISAFGIGLQFARIQRFDLDAYRRFKKIMVFNSPDPDQLEDELLAHPCLFSED